MQRNATTVCLFQEDTEGTILRDWGVKRKSQRQTGVD
jgi:hypothetical protein